MTIRGNRRHHLALAVALSVAHSRCGQQVAPIAPPMRLLAVNDGQSCVVDEHDRVFCWGFVGALATLASPPTLIGSLPGVEQLLPRAASVCARLRDGTVHCAGANESLQLGAAGPERREFAPVTGLRDVVELVASGGRICALSRDRSLRCWGTYAERTEAGGWVARVAPVTQIALPSGTRRFHTQNFCVELESGDVACESRGVFGGLVGPWLPALGPDGRPPSFEVATACSTDETAGVVRCAPWPLDAPPGFSEVFRFYDAVLCGTIGAQLYCRASIDDPRIVRARPSPFAGWSVLDLPPMTEVHASDRHACALDANRCPSKRGGDNYGELGLGRPRFTSQPTEVSLGGAPVRSIVGTGSLLALDRSVARIESVRLAIEDERRDAWRTPFAADNVRVQTLLETSEPVTQLVEVDDTLCVLAGRTRCRSPDGTLFEPFGDDTGRTRSLWLDRFWLTRVRDDGVVEQVHASRMPGASPSTLPFTDAIAVIGDGDRCALDVRGELRCVGGQFPGTIGLDGMPPTTPPVRIASDVRSLHGRLSSPCYIDRNGAAFCWGYDSAWILGFEDHRPIALPQRVAFDRPVVNIDAAYDTVLVVDDRGAVYCRGANFAGQCGASPSRTPSDWRRVEGIDDAVAVRALAGQSCAIRRSGALACWGLATGEFSRFGAQFRSTGAVYIPIPAAP